MGKGRRRPPMSGIDIPDPLPAAITPPRTVIEFLVDEDLDEFGDTGLVARTWHWVLHGGGSGPISHMDWSQFDGDGPPSAASRRLSSSLCFGCCSSVRRSRSRSASRRSNRFSQWTG